MTTGPVWIYVSASMGNPKPTAEVACVCENIIMDATGIASIIKIVERIEAHIPAGLSDDLPAGFPIKAFLRLRANGVQGKGNIRAVITKPDGTVGADAAMLAEFKDHPRAYFQGIFEMHVVKPQDGVYHFEFFWNEESLAVVSIEVAIKLQPQQEPMKSIPAS